MPRHETSPRRSAIWSSGRPAHLRITPAGLALSSIAAFPRAHTSRSPRRLSGFRRLTASVLAALLIGYLLVTVVPLPLGGDAPMQAGAVSRASSGSAASSISPAPAAKAKEAFANLPAVFERNQGQSPSDVAYLARSGGSTLYLTSTKAVLATPKGQLSMVLQGSNPQAELTPTKPLPGIVNYFIGNDPATWHANISTSEGVIYHDVYPGVDLVWYGAGQALEYDFVVAPGADPSKISMAFDGAKSLALDGNGDLLVTLANGTVIRHKAPALYQDTAAGRTKVSGSYRITGTGVGFTVGSYDPTGTLTIDPVLYSTIYTGNTTAAIVNGVDFDNQGNAYIVGSTGSNSPETNTPRANGIDLPTTPGAYQPTAPGVGAGDVAFAAKFNPAASGAASLVYSTFLGGNEADGDNTDATRVAVEKTGTALDPVGTAYVVGTTTSHTFPTTPGAFQTANTGGSGSGDVFIAKLDPSAGSLLYSTYFGGSGNDVNNINGTLIAADGTGKVYAVGATSSTDLPVRNAFQSSLVATGPDVFAMKLDTTMAGNAALLWSTYMGTTGADRPRALVLDAARNAYIAGSTAAAGFPGTAASPIQSTYGGSSTDAFVTELSSSGAQLWATYLGSTGAEIGQGIGLDSGGNVVAAGQTTGAFSGTPGAYQVANAGGTDVFAAKIAVGGGSLLWRTLYGGTGNDVTTGGLSVDPSGTIYVGGGTTSTDLPMAAGAEQPTSGGGTDAFLAKFDSAGTQLLRSTYLGGPSNDTPTQFVRSSATGLSYLVGNNSNVFSADFPTTANAFRQTYSASGGIGVGFLAVLDDPGGQADLSVTKTASAPSVVAGSPLTYTVGVTNNGPGNAAGITLTDTLPSGVTFGSATMSPTGTCTTPPSGQTLTCSIASLPSGASTTLTVQVTPTATGTLHNAVSVASTTTDPNASNDSASVDITVTGASAADLSITKTASPSPGVVGNTLTYTLGVANAGPDSGINTTVTDTLPSGFTFGSATSSVGTCSGTSTVTCSLGTFASGASATITITGTPTAAGSITNTASVSSDSPDASTANNSASVTTPVGAPSADLSITKADFPDPVTTGGALGYTLTVSNAGPSPATGVTVTDTLPASVTFGSATPSQGTCSGTSTVTCNLGTIAASGTATVTISVMAPSSTGSVSNTASVSATEGDPNAANNQATESTTVVPPTAGVPDVVVRSTTTPMTNGSASAMNVTSTCPAGSTLVGGGAFLRRAASASDTPNNGLKLNGTVPSDASGTPSANNATTPSSWTAVAGFGGQSESGDQATAFASCVTNGPTATSVKVSAPVSINTEFVNNVPAQGANTPLKTTATCPSGTRLVGGGALGVPPTEPSFKPVASYPSDASGVASSNGAVNPDSWTAFGSAGAPSAAQQVTAFALCSTDPSLQTTVARTDAPGPQLGTTFTTTTTTCPAGTRMLSGGVMVDKTIDGTGPGTGPGFQPQQGVHVRGSFPSSSSGAEVSDGASNPASWTAVIQSGGQATPGTQAHAFALCAQGPAAPASADLSVTKTASPEPVATGGTITYTLVASNAGPDPATGVVVTDTLPAGVTVVSTPASCTVASGTVSCPVGSLASGSSSTVTITVTAPSSAGSITNTASITGTENDPSTANNSASATTTVTAPVAQADLSITKTDSPDPVQTGGMLTYTLVVKNNGPQGATGVVAKDVLPAGVVFTSASSGCANASGTVTCTVGNLASGASVTKTITTKAPAAGGSITNTASVTGTQSDPNTANNSASASTTVNAPAGPDLAITKSGSPSSLNAGDTLTYTLKATNNGQPSASGVVVTDILPAGVTFSSASSTKGSCSRSGQTVTCSVGTLSKGSSATITIKVKPQAPGSITNTASVVGSASDPNTANNSASVTTTVKGVADVSIKKTGSPLIAHVGQTLTYTLTVKNDGPSGATNVVTTDKLPSGLTFVSATATQGSCANVSGTVTCTLGSLASGASATVTIKTTTTRVAALINTATVKAVETDPKPLNNVAIAATGVIR